MNVAIVVPLVVALVALGAAWAVPHLLAPAPATKALTGALAMAVLGVLSGLVQLALAGASEVPALASAVGWCRALYGGQHGATPAVGAMSLGALVAIGVGAWRQVRRIRGASAAFAAVDGVEVHDLDLPVAFAVPGRPGGVVVSRSLLCRLDGSARRAVLAHEVAHLTHDHHRYVRVAETCAAGLPFLRPFARRVRFLTERWADEVAAAAVGSRTTLARTIAEVSLMGEAAAPPGTAAFGGGSTAARVAALLDPPAPLRLGWPAAAGILVVIAGGSAVQVHHLTEFFRHVCPH